VRQVFISRLLRGELHATAATGRPPLGAGPRRPGHPALPDAALDFVLDGDTELRRSNATWRGGSASRRPSCRRTDRLLHSRLGEIDGTRRAAAALMHGLGFADEDFRRPVRSFRRLARAPESGARLMCRSDLLLLDEPTNHLDLDAIIWLEEWLKSYPGTLILISHDGFLDVITSHILAIEAARCNCSRQLLGLRARARRAPGQRPGAGGQAAAGGGASASYIDASAPRHRRHARHKAASRCWRKWATSSPPHRHALQFSFPEPAASPIRCWLSILQSRLWRFATNIRSAQLHPCDPTAASACLANGAGKSTLMKLLAARSSGGRRARGRTQLSSAIRQHQMNNCAPTIAVEAHDSARSRAPRRNLRGYLGGFDFRGDMVDAPCGRFSAARKRAWRWR